MSPPGYSPAPSSTTPAASGLHRIMPAHGGWVSLSVGFSIGLKTAVTPVTGRTQVSAAQDHGRLRLEGRWQEQQPQCDLKQLGTEVAPVSVQFTGYFPIATIIVAIITIIITVSSNTAHGDYGGEIRRVDSTSAEKGEICAICLAELDEDREEELCSSERISCPPSSS